jgi:hypothetical protein
LFIRRIAAEPIEGNLSNGQAQQEGEERKESGETESRSEGTQEIGTTRRREIPSSGGTEAKGSCQEEDREARAPGAGRKTEEGCQTCKGKSRETGA